MDCPTKGWERRRTSVVRMEHYESLPVTIEPSLASPFSQEPGLETLALLGIVVFFPQSTDGNSLDRLFPTISNRSNIFDKFCVLSLAYRSDGFFHDARAAARLHLSQGSRVVLAAFRDQGALLRPDLRKLQSERARLRKDTVNHVGGHMSSTYLMPSLQSIPARKVSGVLAPRGTTGTVRTPTVMLGVDAVSTCPPSLPIWVFPSFFWVHDEAFVHAAPPLLPTAQPPVLPPPHRQERSPIINPTLKPSPQISVSVV